jgi:hypothetical protein
VNSFKQEISITANDGRNVRGWWQVHNGMVTVSTGLASKTTQVGGSSPENLARMMLYELVKEGKDRPE